MFEIIAQRREGQLWKQNRLPFKGSSLFRFHDSDVNSYVIAYDDVEELVKYLDKKYSCDSETPLFQIVENKIKAIEFKKDNEDTIEETIENLTQFENDNWFISFNGIYPIEKYIVNLKELI